MVAAAAAAATASGPGEARDSRELRPASERFWEQTLELGPSACTDASIEQVTRGRLGPEAPARKPCRESVPQPWEGEVVVFEAFFDAGLGFPASELLAGVLDAFHLELPQLSPNAVARLAIFEWAMRAKGCEGRAEVFAQNHEALCQPKKKGGQILAFGSINFQLRRKAAPLRQPASEGISASSRGSRETDSLDRGGLADPLGAIERSDYMEAELVAVAAGSPVNSIDNLFYRASPSGHGKPSGGFVEATDEGTAIWAVDPTIPPSEDVADARSGAPANATGALGPRGRVETGATEEASPEAAQDTGTRPQAPSSPRGVRSSVPLLHPYLEEGEGFASKVAPVHDYYFHLREAPVIDELRLTDGLELGRTIESAAGQGLMLSLLSERHHREDDASGLSARADAAERLACE
ncbi:hypothetical protein GUJ93_ZPchr0013g34234 [Zizania palustris]|uniref:Transposase (putative) gypsy type domain-containing protein n=1 Tax=Zizania palustris TaxID=103762 RepID=A0A8J5WVK5_ZIZPA|nr:hypothetical protein GUJ93_ZPchr0013g34234 [Zizania palustris]